MFKAIVVDKIDDKPQASLQELEESQLPDEDVLVEIAYSSLNYKDGLALTGVSICRRTPMVCGIDLAGTVVESRVDSWQPGDKVIVNGWGMSETQWGGYSQKQRVNPDWLISLPEAFNFEQAMAIGTAGYTAMLCVLALEDQGVTPDQGPILVTGAGGGVGSVAISLLHKLGYEVHASTGRSEIHDYLKELGAAAFIDRNELSPPGKPFQKERWAGAIDSVGGTTLANVLAQCQYGASVAACGLAGGNDLPASVLPFILRGVKLIGVDSVMAPRAIRERAWSRLATDLDVEKLSAVATTVAMSEVIDKAKDIVAGKVRGRIVIDVNK
ncbi:MAG: acryloyl-CoA reductase [Gammaproteobacteria bacterium]|nr:acryloyl-CoA reductase [Gammaproteobacteria bacterium]